MATLATSAAACGAESPPAPRRAESPPAPAEPPTATPPPTPTKVERAPGPAPIAEPRPEPAKTRVHLPLSGTVLAHGGGAIGRAVFDQFAELCGSESRLVIIPTATEAADKPGYGSKLPGPWTRRGIDTVTVLHTMDRSEADDPTFVRPLADATCVWLGGGAQGRLQDAYVGTRVEAAIHQVLLRGGAVGGYSAGAACMSRTMIRRGNPVPEEGTGFGILPGIVVDQHFLAHEREPRLLAMLGQHPELVGYGIDESTWMVFKGSGFEVFGRSVVRQCRADRGCESLPAGAVGSLAPAASPPPHP